MQKNVAGQHVAFQAVNASDGTAVTSGSPTVYVTIDGGTQTTTTSSAIHEGQGTWSLDLTQAETNGDHIVYTFTLTNAINQAVNVYPYTLTDFQATASDIADAVWDEAQADHTTAGTFGLYLDQTVSTAGDGLTVSAIVDGVWDEPQIGHNTPGSFGLYLDSEVSNASDGLTVQEIVDGVWDEPHSGHNVGGTFGQDIRQIKEGLIQVESSINDPAATADQFDTNLTSAVDDFYRDKVISFISGSLQGQSRVIQGYTGSSKTIILDESLTSAPADGDEFIILSLHVHAMTEIEERVTDSVWDEPQSGHTTVGTFGYYLDSEVSAAGGGSLTVQEIVDGVWDEPQSSHTDAGTFGLYLDSEVSNAGGGSLTVEDIVNGVWDEPQSGHVTIGTFGYYVDSRISQAGGGGDGLTGPYSVTITVENQAGAPIENALVRLSRTGETGTLATDANGEATFSVVSATWDVLVSASGFEGDASQLVVNDDAAATIVLVAASLPSPSSPSLCSVAGYINLNGKPIENAQLRARLRTQSNSSADGVLLSTAKDVASSDIDGLAVLELVRVGQFVDGDGVYIIEAWHDGKKLWDIEAAIPDSPTVNLADLEDLS